MHTVQLKTASEGYKIPPNSSKTLTSVYATNLILFAIDLSIITLNLTKITRELTIWWLLKRLFFNTRVNFKTP